MVKYDDKADMISDGMIIVSGWTIFAIVGVILSILSGRKQKWPKWKTILFSILCALFPPFSLFIIFDFIMYKKEEKK